MDIQIGYMVAQLVFQDGAVRHTFNGRPVQGKANDLRLASVRHISNRPILKLLAGIKPPLFYQLTDGVIILRDSQLVAHLGRNFPLHDDHTVSAIVHAFQIAI